MSSWKRISAAASAAPTVPRARITSGDGPFVSVILRGGLGNRCFQILCGLGYAERHGKRFVLSEAHILSNAHTKKDTTQNILFALFPNVKVYKGPAINWTVLKEPEFGEECVLKNIGGSVLLDGYFQNEAYFPTGARDKFIVPKPEKTVFDISGLDFSKICFVHFRYGDYLSSDYAFDMTKYYKDCVGLAGDVRFLVFSDQPHLINLEKHGLEPGRSLIVPNTVGPWETLYLMSLCSGAICPNSTFSWFGAFAMRGSGQVFMPNKWHKVLDYVPIASWAKFMPID